MEPIREIFNAQEFRNDRDKHIPRPERLTPEPGDIDRASREHNPEWREALRERIGDEPDAG